MRVFVAVDIEADIRGAVGDLQAELRDKAGFKKGDVKWVDTENMHLTLKFLGEIKDAECVEVCRIAEQTAGRYDSFDLQIEKVGHFGGRIARVLWVGAGAGGDELAALQKDLEQGLVEAGQPADVREFSAHLTLCRIRNPKAGKVLADVSWQYKDYDFGATRIDSIVVYQSELTPKGPVYTALGRYGLKLSDGSV